MKVIWRLETATVRDVYEALRAKRTIAYTTVMTMMRILEEKGYLKKDIPPHHLTYIFYGAIETFISVMVLGKEPLTKKRQERAVNAIMEVFMDGAKAA